jgi:hypothetical protein
MDDELKVLACFKDDVDVILSPKALARKCEMNPGKIQRLLSSLLAQEKIERVSKGRYRLLQTMKTAPDSRLARLVKAVEKTSEIAIHELMLAEPLVGPEDRKEIEHQIAYFARHLVRIRWEMEHGGGLVEVDNDLFERARRIHEWTRMVHEKSKDAK